MCGVTHIFQVSTHFIIYYLKGAHLFSGLIRKVFKYQEAMKFLVVLAFCGAQFFILGNKSYLFDLKGQAPFVHF